MDRAIHPPVIDLTPGDPAGIGPEVMLAAWHAQHKRALLRLCGAADVWLRAARQLGIADSEVAAALLDDADAARECAALPPLGAATVQGARVAWAALDQAVARALAGETQAIVTGPIAKATMLEAGFGHAGHTEYLRERAGVPCVLMVMDAPHFIVGLQTVHVPLSAVPTLMQSQRIVERARLLASHLRRRGIAHPKLALCGVNPHAGEGGSIGQEDREIAAAVEILCREGLEASGPWPGDTVFAAMAQGRFDAVLAMYHDQGLAPFKLLHFHDGVNVTVGLPFVRTSPDHGTAFALAGSGNANAASATAAVALAVQIVTR